MKAGGAPAPSQPGVPSEAPGMRQIVDAKNASVPVVVLGANIGGLAAAVAIRSRTGRAVCVLDIEGEQEREQESGNDTSYFLSARCMDAVRAINADLHRAFLASMADEATAARGTVSRPDLTARLSSSLLRDLLTTYLTKGCGGSSFIWRSSSVKRISFLSNKEKVEGTRKDRCVVIVFENGTVIKADLVVVAAEVLPLAGLTDEVSCEESLAEGTGKGVWPLNGNKGFTAVDFERALASPSSVPPPAVLCPESPRPEAAAEKKTGTVQDENSLLTVPTLLSTELGKVGKNGSCARSGGSTPTVADSPWSFWNGRVILTGPAAHPWASSLDEGLEFDVEDAAQLGCSLFDWKFEMRMASDRFQAIRKRRLATLPTSPKLPKSWTSDSPADAVGEASTAASPSAFNEEVQAFVPTRDAYAELLPAGGLGYEVQHAEIY